MLIYACEQFQDYFLPGGEWILVLVSITIFPRRTAFPLENFKSDPYPDPILYHVYSREFIYIWSVANILKLTTWKTQTNNNFHVIYLSSLLEYRCLFCCFRLFWRNLSKRNFWWIETSFYLITRCIKSHD